MSETLIGLKSFTTKLKMVSKRANDVRPAFDHFGDWLVEQEALQFATKGHRWSEMGWAPLDPQYASWKAAHGYTEGVLIRDRNLVDSLTKRPMGVEHITKDEARFGTDVPYAKFHQTGTRFMPRRKVLPTLDDTEVAKVAKKFVAQWVMHGHV